MHGGHVLCPPWSLLQSIRSPGATDFFMLSHPIAYYSCHTRKIGMYDKGIGAVSLTDQITD